jgi:glutaredoxin
MNEVVLYTRAGCHLCDEAKQVLRDADVVFSEVDIDADAALRARYNEEVPVVFIDGRKAFKYHVDPRELQRWLSADNADERR